MALAPLFFADPAGAVFGKFFSKINLNIVWWENKTIIGSVRKFSDSLWDIVIPSKHNKTKTSNDSTCKMNVILRKESTKKELEQNFYMQHVSHQQKVHLLKLSKMEILIYGLG